MHHDLHDPFADLRSLTLEGGGIKGLAYLGFLQELEARLPVGFRQLEHIPATSAGAITGALIAAGATGADLERLVASTPFRRISDSRPGVVRDALAFTFRGGWHRLRFARRWLGEALWSLGWSAEATFADLRSERGVRLLLPAVDEHSGRLVVFGEGELTDRPIIDGVLASMAIPLWFHRLGGRYSDGGLVWNFPLGLAARDFSSRQILGLRVDSTREIHGAPPPPPWWRHLPLIGRPSWLLQIASTEANTARELSELAHRVVRIDTGTISAVDFGLDAAGRAGLVAAGRRAFDAFLHHQRADTPR